MENRMGFGAFLAPHHPTGENPTLQLQRDLRLATLLDDLGYDEFWVGEHHSGGWETIFCFNAKSKASFFRSLFSLTHRDASTTSTG